MKRCGTCGAELPDEAAFCPVCEKELVEKVRLRAPWPRRRLILAVLALALLAVGFGIWRGIDRKRPTAEPAAAPVASDAAMSDEADAFPAGETGPDGQSADAGADASAALDAEEEPDPRAAAYAQAEALLAAGETYKAARAFYAIRDYEDAWQRCFEAWGLITERKTLDAGGAHALGLHPGGSVVADGGNVYALEAHGQCEVSGWSDIVAVAAGTYNSVGLRADGTVLATGHDGLLRCHRSFTAESSLLVYLCHSFLGAT